MTRVLSLDLASITGAAWRGPESEFVTRHIDFQDRRGGWHHVGRARRSYQTDVEGRAVRSPASTSAGAESAWMMTDPDQVPQDYYGPDLETIAHQRPQYRFGGMPLYRDPDPVTVARLWRSHGYQAVLERWFWKNHTDLQVIRKVGEERMAKMA